MCFLLYAGTYQLQIKAYFSKPEVQNIGSTSGCGCDFPTAIFQNCGWPEIECADRDEKDKKSDQFNREGLVGLLRTIEEDWIELYCIWAGAYAQPPIVREELSVRNLPDSRFYFNERGFDKVVLKEPDFRPDQRT